MGTMKVSASEAGYLVNRHERIVRGRIHRGDLPATKERQAWRIAVDDLERIPGWHIDRARLAQLEERSAHSVETMAARLATLERELRDVRARLRTLEGRQYGAALGDASAQGPAAGDSGDNPGSNGADGEYRRPLVIPYNANLVQAPPPAPGDFPSRQAAARFLDRHGIPEQTARAWWNGKPWPAMPRDALADALRRLAEPDAFRRKWRDTFRQCADDPACACHELLAGD